MDEDIRRWNCSVSIATKERKALTPSVLTAFAMFLRDHEYTTSMWARGFGPTEAEVVCKSLTKWGKETFSLDGEFLMLWSERENGEFRGDCELVYFYEGRAYLMPNPFLEGDSEGFVMSMMSVVSGSIGDLYAVSLVERDSHNAR